MKDINSLSRLNIDILDNIKDITFPDFFQNIFEKENISKNGIIDFLERFGIRYIILKDFRDYVKDISFYKWRIYWCF